MTKLINLKIREINLVKEFNDNKNKNMQLCKKYLSLDKNIKYPTQLLPQQSKFEVSFELKNTNTEIANGIRRCILGELDVISMSFDEKDFETDDAYILSDFFKKQLELLPKIGRAHV